MRAQDAAVRLQKARRIEEDQRIVEEGKKAQELTSWDEEKFNFIIDGLVCGKEYYRIIDGEITKRVCAHRAGSKTAHEGVGFCWVHGGTKKDERRVGALIMAHAIAAELDVTPWDALLVATRRFAAMAAFYDMKLAEVTDDEDLMPGGDAYFWVKKSEELHEKAARFGKMAIDAGVAERIVHQVELEGSRIVEALNKALGALSLSQSDEDVLRHTLALELRKFGAQSHANVKEIEG